MAAGSEALVLKISADTTAVAAGLQPMSTALDGLKTTAAATSEQLGALSDKSVAPTVDTSSMDSLAKAADETTQSLSTLDTQTVTPTVDSSSVEQLGTSIDDTKDSAEELSRSPITIQMRREALDKAKRDIEELKDRIAEEVQMGVSTRDSEKELSALQRSVDTLTDEDHTIEVSVDDVDTSFALENLGKLRKNARAVTDAFISLQSDGLNSLPGALSAANTSMLLLNNSIDSYIAKREAANVATSTMVGGFSKVTSFLAGPWGLAIGAGITLLGTLISSTHNAEEATKDFASAIDFEAGALDRSNRQKLATTLANQDMLKETESIGVAASDLITALLEGGDASERMHTRLQGIFDTAPGFSDMKNNAKEVLVSYEALSKELAAGQVIQQATKRAIGDVGEASKSTAAATKDQASEVDKLNRAYENAISSIKLYNGVVGDTHAKQIAVKEDFASLREIVGEAGRAVNHARTAFDLNKQKGREAETQIDRTAAAIADLTQTQLDYAIKHGKSTDKIVENYGRQRQQLIDTAVQLGLSKTAATTYVDKLLDTPKEVKTKVTVSGAKEAEAAIDDVARARTVHLMLEASLSPNAKKLLNDPRLNGSNNPNLQSAPAPPPAVTPHGGLTLLQPRLYLDGRPIRYALRGDVQSTVAAQLAATRTRGRL